MNTNPPCRLLEALPTELRLRIYDYIFTKQYSPVLLIKSDFELEMTSLAKAPANVLQTCKTIRNEATPLLYETTTFRIHVSPIDGHSLDFTRVSDKIPFLKHIRHLDLRANVLHSGQMVLTLQLLRTLCEALERTSTW